MICIDAEQTNRLRDVHRLRQGGKAFIAFISTHGIIKYVQSKDKNIDNIEMLFDISIISLYIMTNNKSQDIICNKKLIFIHYSRNSFL